MISHKVGPLWIAILLVGALLTWYVVSGPTGSVRGVSTANWWFDGSSWRVSGKAPSCPKPLTLLSPVPLLKATSILYPGQTRGGNYKPHGGFRFDTSKSNDITVKAPMDALLVRGSRYIEIGEVQYMFEFVNPCGIMYRFDHLRVLSPKLAAVATTLPTAKKDDSRTTNLSSTVTVAAGEVIATAVGYQKSNTSVDWGVYDLRSKNGASKQAAWAAQHDNELAEHAICWFDVLSLGDKVKAKKLPGSGVNGKKSDFCK